MKIEIKTLFYGWKKEIHQLQQENKELKEENDKLKKYTKQLEEDIKNIEKGIDSYIGVIKDRQEIIDQLYNEIFRRRIKKMLTGE